MPVRIYQVGVEHKHEGLNWSGFKVRAKTCDEAIKKARAQLQSYERLQSIELLESED